MGRSRKDRWIQEAIEHPGALRRYVRRVYGERGFTKDGKIRMDILKDLAKRRDTIGRRARLALTLRKLAKKRKKGRKRR